MLQNCFQTQSSQCVPWIHVVWSCWVLFILDFCESSSKCYVHFSGLTPDHEVIFFSPIEDILFSIYYFYIFVKHISCRDELVCIFYKMSRTCKNYVKSICYDFEGQADITCLPGPNQQMNRIEKPYQIKISVILITDIWWYEESIIWNLFFSFFHIDRILSV